jgi:ribosomal subunit interface protein
MARLKGMKVIIQGKQLRLSRQMKAYAESHVVAPLRRFYDNEAAELRVELGRSNVRGDSRECHLTLHMPGTRTIQIEESTPDVYACLDAAADRLVRTAKKELSRMRSPGGRRLQHPRSRLAANGSAEST